MMEYWVIERPDGSVTVHKSIDGVTGAFRRVIWRRMLIKIQTEVKNVS